MHRSEIYASLSATLFLYYYRKYFSVPLNKKYTSIYDNQAYINQLSWLLEDEISKNNLHKTTEDKAYAIILKIIPDNFKIEHIHRHQDTSNNYNSLTTKAKLNVDTDIIVTKYSSVPLNSHVTSPPFSFYISKTYAHQNVDFRIRKECHALEV